MIHANVYYSAPFLGQPETYIFFVLFWISCIVRGLFLECSFPVFLCFRVPLPNGGSLVIEQTEALVSIDVNGGHGMLGQGTSQEKAILDVNLTAAKQVSLNAFFCVFFNI